MPARFARLLTLILLVALTVGCGDSHNYVFTGSTSGAPQAHTLTVTTDTAPVTARIAGQAASFKITVYNAELSQVDSRDIGRGQSAGFADLPTGTYIIRAVGLNANSESIGYFDRTIVVDSDITVQIPGLIYTRTIPAIGSTKAPFLIFIGLPDSVQSGQTFSLSVAAFDANGAPLTTASGNVSLAVTGLTLGTVPAPAPLGDGKATFANLSFPSNAEGAVTFTATHETLGSASTPEIQVSRSPGQRLAVGNYYGTNVTIYNLNDLTDEVNDVAPAVVVETAPEQSENWDLEPALDGQAFWFCNTLSEVALFTELQESNANGPSHTLQVAVGAAALSNDHANDTLYVAERYEQDGSYGLSIFEDATSLPNGSSATRRVTNFPDVVTGVAYVPSNDSLFVIGRNGVNSEFELHHFTNVSDPSFQGDQTAIAHNVSTVEFVAHLPFDLSYDAANDRLYLGSYYPGLTGFYFLDNASDLPEDATTSMVSSGADLQSIAGVFFDALSNVLYVTDIYHNHVLIYEDPGSISGGSITVAPDRVLSGMATLLNGPTGVCVLR